MICDSFVVKGSRASSNTRLSMSLSVIIPTGVSSCTMTKQPISCLLIISTASLTIDATESVMTGLTMTSSTFSDMCTSNYLSLLCILYIED